MAPQWNLLFTDSAKLKQAERVLTTSWAREPGNRLFAFETVGNMINFNFSQKNLHPVDLDTPCVFPDAGGRRLSLRELGVAADSTPKEGYHEQAGVLLMRGAGVRPGARVRQCTNLDIAPTLLHLMGVPIPIHMRGRVLEEALERAGGAGQPPRPRVPVPALAEVAV
jgi:hypothetical protein